MIIIISILVLAVCSFIVFQLIEYFKLHKQKPIVKDSSNSGNDEHHTKREKSLYHSGNNEESLYDKVRNDEIFSNRLRLFFPEDTVHTHADIIEKVAEEIIANGNFENTNKIIENKKQGFWIIYYSNGNQDELPTETLDLIEYTRRKEILNQPAVAVIKTEGSYFNDKPNGLWKHYNKNGFLSAEIYYVEGQRDTYKEYFGNGILKMDFNYKNNEKHGKNNEYYEDGSKNIIANYRNGELHGLREQYYPSGNLEMRTTYENGLGEGVHTYLGDDGEIIEQKIMKNGLDIMAQLIKLTHEDDQMKLSLFTDGPEKVEKWTMAQRMYDYTKSNNLNVEPMEISALNRLFDNGSLDKETYDLMSDVFKNPLTPQNSLEDAPFTCKLSSIVRVATINEYKEHFENALNVSGANIKEGKEIGAIIGFMTSSLLLRYNFKTISSDFSEAPIVAMKLDTKGKSFDFGSYFNSLRVFFIQNHINLFGFEPDLQEGHILLDKSNNSTWKIEGDLCNKFTTHKFKNIEYKWCGSKWEDEYLNTYLVKLINYDEYLYINIKSENDLKLEDIFEDIGF